MSSSHTILGLITARGGSKGIPGKNLAPVGGKPLIAWTVEAARAARRLTRTIVTTDDPAIAAAAREAGAEVPFMRPRELAADDTKHLAVVEHALRWLKEHEGWQPEYLLVLQPTSPLREARDIDAAIELAERCDADSVIGLCETTAHPHWMKQLDDGGRVRPFLPDADPEARRQELPNVYIVNGAIYLVRPELVLARRTFYTDKTFGYIMPRERSIDIDEPLDLKLCDLILRERIVGGGGAGR